MDESYKELEEKVWKTDRCWSCGACVTVCPAGVINFDKYAEAYYTGKRGKEEDVETFYTADMPASGKECIVTKRSISCGACYTVCPQSESMDEIAKDLFEKEKIEYEDEYIGKIKGVFASSSTEKIRYAQSGGAISSILAAALEEDLIDGALVMTVDRLNMKPQAKVAIHPKEIISAAGSKYDWSPIMLGMKDAVENEKLKRLAIVGTPCVIRAARRIVVSENEHVKRYGETIRIFVGLVCAGIFGRGRLIIEKICDDMDISPWQIEKIDAKKGKIWVYLKGGGVKTMSLKDAKSYRLAGCKYCIDFTNELADISIGDMGTKEGYSTLIVRRDIGAGLVANAVDKGYLRLSREVNPSPIIKMAAKKKSIEWDDETISGLNSLIQRSTFLKSFVEE